MENKTSKYFKYAIGEIILVMIGILLALQVNNWNEERKFNGLKKVYIERLMEDLKQDTANISLVSQHLNKKQKIIKKSIDDIDSKEDSKLLIPSIENYFDEGWNMLDFTPSMVTYSDLSQTGNMNVFRNSVLTENIQQYYVTIEGVIKGQNINKDWIIPLDVALSKESSAFEFDPNTKELFKKNDVLHALKVIIEQKELFKRNAAGHYWFNKSLSRDISKIKITANELIRTLQLELEKDK